MMKRLSTLAASLVLVTSANATLLNYFDSNLGTLTGATLTISGQASYFGTLFNLSPDTSLITSADVTVDFNFISSDSLIDFALLLNPLSSTQSSGDVPLVESTSSFFDIFFDISNSYDLSPILGSLYGTGTFSVACQPSSTIQYTGESFVFGDSVATGSIDGSSCAASILYAFDNGNTVPEPGTMALVGLALAGMGFAARRRKAV